MTQRKNIDMKTTSGVHNVTHKHNMQHAKFYLSRDLQAGVFVEMYFKNIH